MSWLPRRVAPASDMFRYLLIISPLDCFVPRNDAGVIARYEAGSNPDMEDKSNYLSP
jgi:hypothetical protein